MGDISDEQHAWATSFLSVDTRNYDAQTLADQGGSDDVSDADGDRGGARGSGGTDDTDDGGSDDTAISATLADLPEVAKVLRMGSSNYLDSLSPAAVSTESCGEEFAKFSMALTALATAGEDFATHPTKAGGIKLALALGATILAARSYYKCKNGTPQLPPGSLQHLEEAISALETDRHTVQHAAGK